ncbi:hypothetical protein CLOM_g1528 [Closterium sp. NIES-68]|nr:hypothetical protein CLOM_g1528 [Closterium sp. NIES-68]
MAGAASSQRFSVPWPASPPFPCRIPLTSHRSRLSPHRICLTSHRIRSFLHFQIAAVIGALLLSFAAASVSPSTKFHNAVSSTKFHNAFPSRISHAAVPSPASFPGSTVSLHPSRDFRPSDSLIPDEDDDVAPWNLDEDDDVATRTPDGDVAPWRLDGEESGDAARGSVPRRKLISGDARGTLPRRKLISSDARAGAFSRRKRWKERLVRKLGPGKNNLREYLRAEGSLRSENLTTRYRMESLHHVFLDYHNQSHQQTDDLHIRCKGGECPDFQQCSGNFTAVDACYCPDMEDLSRRAALAPLNCPRIKKVLVDSPLNVKPVRIVFDPNCSHSEDDIPHFAWVSQMFNLRHVYFNSRGQAFNDSFLYDRNGCGSEHKFDIPEGTRVTVYDKIINLAHWNAYQFYHGILELVPVFFMLSKAPHLVRSLPMAVQYLQMDFLEKLGTFFIGLDTVHMHLRVVPDDEVFFAHQVLQPYYQWCGRPSRSLWRHFRRLYLLPADGLPMFLPDWTPRINSAMQTDSAIFPGAPADWVVILARRYNTRALEQHAEVEEMLCSLFPRERVVVFDGSLRIADAKALFNRAVLFVAVHGAALTNTIFMPFKSVVLELRPRDFHKACYHHLAEVCDLHYLLLLCDGAKDTPLSCDSNELKAVFEDVHGRVEKVLELGQEVQLEEGEEQR